MSARKTAPALPVLRTFHLTDSRVPSGDRARIVEVLDARQLMAELWKVWKFTTKQAQLVADYAWLTGVAEISEQQPDGSLRTLEIACPHYDATGGRYAFKLPALVNARTLAADGKTYEERSAEYAAFAERYKNRTASPAAAKAEQ